MRVLPAVPGSCNGWLVVLVATLFWVGCAATSNADRSDETQADAGVNGTHADGGVPPDGGTGAPTSSNVAFTASDGVRLTGRLTVPAGGGTGQPGVVLLHQFGLDLNQWGSLESTLATQGYRVLAFSLRGHGTSDPYAGGSLEGLLTDPDGAPRDVTAALERLGTELQADPARLAAVGTSVGANLAVAAAIRGQVKSAVAFSARKPPTEALARTPATGMANVFYLAGELDRGGQAADAQTLFDATAEPRDLHIWPQTDDHGMELLQNHPEATTLLLQWLRAHL
jgi:dienelactone hydrolase